MRRTYQSAKPTHPPTERPVPVIKKGKIDISIVPITFFVNINMTNILHRLLTCIDHTCHTCMHPSITSPPPTRCAVTPHCQHTQSSLVQSSSVQSCVTSSMSLFLSVSLFGMASPQNLQACTLRPIHDNATHIADIRFTVISFVCMCVSRHGHTSSSQSLASCSVVTVLVTNRTSLAPPLTLLLYFFDKRPSRKFVLENTRSESELPTHPACARPSLPSPSQCTFTYKHASTV